MEDDELLREYAERRSDQAFAGLVERHIDLVYSTALRLVGEASLAKDIAQMVFIELAQKPGSVANPSVLAGWLYRATRFTASSVLRRERRRRSTESAAMELKAIETDARSIWESLAPHLDAAIATLEPDDQDAVALRFFKGKSLREVGQALGGSEDAAQKRVARALEKLRSYFTRKGVTASTALIASAMAAHAVQAAPAGMAAAVASSSLAALAGASVWTLKLLDMMTAANLKIGVVTLLLAAAATTPILLGRHYGSPVASTATQWTNQTRLADSRALRSAPATSGAAGRRVKESPLDPLFVESAKPLEPAQIEAYLDQSNRSSESLLAAYRMSKDKRYLQEAAARFPNDKAVQFTVIASDLFPGEQRKWIDAFKAAAPDNALAVYFSALDHFQAKHSDLALLELAQAAGCKSFDNYGAQTIQAVEEMQRLAGRSPLSAKFTATCGGKTPSGYVNKLKALGGEIGQAQQSYRDQADEASACSVAAMGWALGDRMRSGGIIDQLAGGALQKKILGQLDPAINYDFVGRPAAEAVAEIDRQKQETAQIMQVRDRVLPGLGETELSNYLDREKLYGELGAMQWLQAQYGSVPMSVSDSNASGQ